MTNLARALASRLAKVLPDGFEIRAQDHALVYGPAGEPDEVLELPADIADAELDLPSALQTCVEKVLAQVQGAVMVHRRGGWPDWLERPGAGPRVTVVRDGLRLQYGDNPDVLSLEPIFLRRLGWPPLRWDDDEPSDPFGAEVERWFADRLAPDGWLVKVSRDVGSDWLQVALEHALGGQRRHLIEESSTWRGVAEEQLAAFAFQCVRDLPDDLPHFDLLGSLRGAPGAPHRLEREFFCALACRLHGHDVITYNEYRWLCWAGPAWSNKTPPEHTWRELPETMSEL